MDKADLNEEVKRDFARESLIAISYNLPETNLSADITPKNTNGGEAVQPLVRDGEEKCRSELISISYSPSPDVKVQPILPPNLDG